jgi:hypothetical protein
LHLSLFYGSDIRGETRREVERYTETSWGSSEREREREREREHIEADAGAGTKTRTKMRKRKNKRKKKQKQSRPTRGPEGPEEGDSRVGLKPPPQPQPQLEHLRKSR